MARAFGNFAEVELIGGDKFGKRIITNYDEHSFRL